VTALNGLDTLTEYLNGAQAAHRYAGSVRGHEDAGPSLLD
jgi:hypothetical protein